MYIINTLFFGATFVVMGSTKNSGPVNYEPEFHNWSNFEGTVILGYRRHVFEEDRFVRAFCDDYGYNLTRCKLHMDLPRFSNSVVNEKKCETYWDSWIRDRGLVLPSRLASVGNTIIFPATYNHTDNDLLTIRLIHMETCEDHDITTKSVVRGSEYRIFPFSDSFDLFYQVEVLLEDGALKQEEKPTRYLKQAFYENGTNIDEEPLDYFQYLPAHLISPSKEKLRIPEKYPVSLTERSRGYIVTSLHFQTDHTKIYLLKPDGKRGDGYDLDFLVASISLGTNRILMYGKRYTTGSSNIIMVVLNSNMTEINRISYPLDEFETKIGFFPMNQDVVAINHKKLENGTTNQIRSEDYLLRIPNNDPRYHVKVPIFFGKSAHNAWIVPSFASGRICVNIISHDIRPTFMNTTCITEDSLNPT